MSNQQLNFESEITPDAWDNYCQDRPVDIESTLRDLYFNDCGTHAYRIVCEVNSCRTIHTKVIYGDGERHKSICPICSNNKAKSRARDAYHLIYGFSWQNLGCLELTTPSDFIDSNRLDDHDYLLEQENHLFHLVHQFFKKYFPNTPYIASFHHWHSKTPLVGVHYHIHVVFPRAEYHYKTIEHDSTKLIDQSLEIVWTNWHPAKIPLEQLEDMRACWSDLLHVKESDIYYQFIKRDEPTEVMHRLRYMFRGYIEDVNKWLLESQDNSLEIPGILEIKTSIEWHLREWRKKTRYYGQWSHSQVSKWIDRQEIESRILHDKTESSKTYCRNCLALLPQYPEVSSGGEVDFESDKAPLRKKWKPKRPPDSCMLQLKPSPKLKGIQLPSSNPKLGRLRSEFMLWQQEQFRKHREWLIQHA